ncbi:MAG: hypothetical protein RQ758_00350 [Methanomicrobiaceae archaeon]|nr:hypothetical protein [Methanomicrobiaceae archaeon]
MLRCPICRSPALYLVAGGYGGMVYRCKKCGYQGSLGIELCDEEDETPGTPRHKYHDSE